MSYFYCLCAVFALCVYVCCICTVCVISQRYPRICLIPPPTTLSTVTQCKFITDSNINQNHLLLRSFWADWISCVLLWQNIVVIITLASFYVILFLLVLHLVLWALSLCLGALYITLCHWSPTFSFLTQPFGAVSQQSLGSLTQYHYAHFSLCYALLSPSLIILPGTLVFRIC